MRYGFCNLALVPMKREPSNTSEQVSQLLFGETFDVIETTSNHCLIKTHHDLYQGWISKKQFLPIENSDLKNLNSTPNLISTKLFTTIKQTDMRYGHSVKIPLALGSVLCYYNYTVGDFAFSAERNDVLATVPNDFSLLINIAKTLLNAPYQWGGRSVLGIDCSGFTQLCYRFIGINLLRDASQQSQQGKFVSDIENAQTGDLCFFSQPNCSKITHTGIYLGEGKIIHSSGRVRIDNLNTQGIEDINTNELTHKLLLIKTFAQ